MQAKRLTVLALLFWLTASLPISAQSPEAFLVGVVRDQSGAVLPGATVTVRSEDGRFERFELTDAVGRYRVGPLSAGTYTITAELAGFAPSTRPAVLVEAGKEVTIDFDLSVGGTSEVVTVTARRVEESLQNVPISVAVVSNEEIQQRAIVDFSGLAFQMPNVLVEEAGNRPGRTSVTIRGVPGRTGIYMDDVFVGDASANNVMLLDIDRVEVLRGPQGTLFGRNSIAGTVNTITNKPSTSAWLGTGELWGGDYSTLIGNGVISGPIVKDRLGINFVAGFRNRDGYENTVSGENVNNEKQWAARTKIYYTPSEAVSLLLSGDYHHDDSRVGYGDAVEDFGVLGAFYQQAKGAGQPYDRVVGDRNIESKTERDVYGGSAKLDWQLRRALFESISGYRGSTSNNYRDGDGGIADIVTGNQPVDYRSFSQEFRLSGATGALTWQGGFYYFNDTREFTDFNRLGPDFAVAVVPALAPLVGNPYGVVTIGKLYSSPLLQAIIGLRPPTPYADRSTFNRNEIASLAGYGSLVWHIGKRWDSTFGLRYTHESIDAAYSQDGVDWSPIDPDIPLTPLSDTDDDVSPLFSVLFKATPNTSVYGTASKGFQSGGFNLAPGSATADQRRFQPEKVWNTEGGVKSAFAQGRMFASVAVFYMKYQDFQRSQSRVTPEGQLTYTFNTNATSKGFEVEVSGTPIRRLTVTGGIGYQDSTYDSYPDAPVNTPDGLKIVDLTGQTLPFVPNWTNSVSAYYDAPLAPTVLLRVGTDFQYRSKYQVNDGPDPRLVVDSTALWNIDFGVQFQRYGLELRARLLNLLDQWYMTSLDFNNIAGTTIVDLSAPRTFLVQLRVAVH